MQNFPDNGRNKSSQSQHWAAEIQQHINKNSLSPIMSTTCSSTKQPQNI